MFSLFTQANTFIKMLPTYSYYYVFVFDAIERKGYCEYKKT